MIEEYAKAISTYQKALKLNPESAECHFNIASAYNDQKDKEMALKHYKESLYRDEGNVETMCCVAQTLEALKLLGEALEMYKTVLQVDPDNTSAIEALVKLERELKK